MRMGEPGNGARFGFEGGDLFPAQRTAEYLYRGLRLQVGVLPQVDVSKPPSSEQADQVVIAEAAPCALFHRELPSLQVCASGVPFATSAASTTAVPG